MKHDYVGYEQGCRCEVCKRSHADRMKMERLKRGEARPDMHGKRSTYVNWSCRCEACTAAHMEYERVYYAKRKAKREGL